MRKVIVFIVLAAVFALALINDMHVQPHTKHAPVTSDFTKDDFHIAIIADKQIYHKNEKIKVYATFEYVGDKDEIKIWHGLPYLGFSIKDANGDYFMRSVQADALKSTIIKKNVVYKFDFQKSGGFSADDPKADFWRKFYSEKDLRMPVGTYTIIAAASFILNDFDKKDIVVPAEIKIKVMD